MVYLIASQMEEHKLMRSSFQQSYMGSVVLTAPLVFKLMVPEDFTYKLIISVACDFEPHVLSTKRNMRKLSC